MDGAFIGNHGRIELYVDISMFNTEIRHADHLAMRQDLHERKSPLPDSESYPDGSAAVT
jgi:hypothetical protein